MSTEKRKTRITSEVQLEMADRSAKYDSEMLDRIENLVNHWLDMQPEFNAPPSEAHWLARLRLLKRIAERECAHNYEMAKYGKRATTLWRESCLDHLEICDNPDCCMRMAMKSWNKILAEMTGYVFANVQSSASSPIYTEEANA